MSTGEKIGRYVHQNDKSGLVPKLRGLMIRHTKSQRIGGEVCVASVLRDMSVHERMN